MKDSAGFPRGGFMTPRGVAVLSGAAVASRIQMISLLARAHVHTNRAAETKGIGHTCVEVCVGEEEWGGETSDTSPSLRTSGEFL